MVVRLLLDEDEAKDAVQEILIKLWENRKRLEKHPNVEGYVFLVARNYCLDKLRQNKKRGRSLSISENLNLDTHFVSNQPEKDELTKRVQKIILELPENQREVVQLRDLDGLEYNEIEEVTGLKVAHLRVLLSRARQHIRLQLSETENYETGTGG